jgi:outer membrane lipoprotein SlyB
MKNLPIFSTAILIGATLIGGCANNSPSQSSSSYETSYSPPSQSRYSNVGVIDSVQLITYEAQNTTGTGAVVGGLIGGLLGNQVGGGSGKTAATVVGVVGGAVVGNNVEKNRNSGAKEMYRINIRLDNGGNTSIEQDTLNGLRTGDRVRISDGHVYRY